MDFTGAARKVTPEEIDQIAESSGVEPAAFRSVITVEAAGSGFDKAGRPKALFERHHFYKHLKDAPGLQANAEAEGLAYPKWGTKPYPKGSDAVYAEIERACAIDEEAALLSTSWGLGQIMGSNFKMAGCKSVEEMVQEACESEAGQLRQMASFIKSAGLQDELKAKNWAGFAKGYNGPGYAKNAYDVKLAQAYDKISSVG
jgi:hypothetical protein